ncbi:MAG: Hsp20/alpha crystallin family protein [Desulfuromonadia bacterium]
MSERTITVNQETKPANREETRSPEVYGKPPVTIIENDEGILLAADLPGANKEGISLHVEKGILTIEARTDFAMPGKEVYSEFRLTPYFRQFSIPDTLDHEKGSADFTNGLLCLTLPKAAAAKPRKIQVSAG